MSVSQLAPQLNSINGTLNRCFYFWVHPVGLFAVLESAQFRSVKRRISVDLTLFRLRGCKAFVDTCFSAWQVCLKDFGFPGHVLPKLPMKYQVREPQHQRSSKWLGQSALKDVP